MNHESRQGEVGGSSVGVAIFAALAQDAYRMIGNLLSMSLRATREEKLGCWPEAALFVKFQPP